ncbi:Uncharacterised protein [Amycolatopsis camponoti]|uniref:Uncharacterized protein n=1 Tax=Amycolatopsis camponoti TaxID=2606593 RepID=A0A6I8LNH4_9PSEU|nr:Uncharacterised protein [Amycolatopsis camponoti]
MNPQSRAISAIPRPAFAGSASNAFARSTRRPFSRSATPWPSSKSWYSRRREMYSASAILSALSDCSPRCARMYSSASRLRAAKASTRSSSTRNALRSTNSARPSKWWASPCGSSRGPAATTCATAPANNDRNGASTSTGRNISGRSSANEIDSFAAATVSITTPEGCRCSVASANVSFAPDSATARGTGQRSSSWMPSGSPRPPRIAARAAAAPEARTTRYPLAGTSIDCGSAIGTIVPDGGRAPREG